MGHVATKQELLAILRRFDMDGDAKIAFKEWKVGMKSTLTVFKQAQKRRPRSSGSYSIKVVRDLTN